MSLDSYGHFLMSSGRVKAASEQFQQALEVAEDLFGEASEQALAASNALATTASMLGQTERADRYNTTLHWQGFPLTTWTLTEKQPN